MKRIWLGLLALLGILATFFKLRGDTFKAKAKHANEKAETLVKSNEVKDEQLKAASDRPKNKEELIDRINSDNF